MIVFIAEKQNNELSKELLYKTKMIADKLENVAKTGCVDTYQRIIEGEEDKNIPNFMKPNEKKFFQHYC